MPPLCWRWKKSDGWGLTKASVNICTDQAGNYLGQYSW